LVVATGDTAVVGPVIEAFFSIADDVRDFSDAEMTGGRFHGFGERCRGGGDEGFDFALGDTCSRSWTSRRWWARQYWTGKEEKGLRRDNRINWMGF
jgi:hypothetical protein